MSEAVKSSPTMVQRRALVTRMAGESAAADARSETPMRLEPEAAYRAGAGTARAISLAAAHDVCYAHPFGWASKCWGWFMRAGVLLAAVLLVLPIARPMAGAPPQAAGPAVPAGQTLVIET